MVILFVVMKVFEVEGVMIDVVDFVVGYLFGEYLVFVVVGVLSIVDIVCLLCICGVVM